MDMLGVFVPIDTGTTYTQRYIINPLFVLLMEAQAYSLQRIMKAFSIGPRRENDDRGATTNKTSRLT